MSTLPRLHTPPQLEPEVVKVYRPKTNIHVSSEQDPSHPDNDQQPEVPKQNTTEASAVPPSSQVPPPSASPKADPDTATHHVARENESSTPKHANSDHLNSTSNVDISSPTSSPESQQHPSAFLNISPRGPRSCSEGDLHILKLKIIW